MNIIFNSTEERKTAGMILFFYFVHQFIVIGSIWFSKVVYGRPGTPRNLGSILRSLTNWDGKWYLKIAHDGYNYLSAAFFPLYPVLIRLFKLTHMDWIMAGLVVSNLSLLWACFVFYKLLRLDYDETACRKTLWFFLLFPTAFYFTASYSESLFLLLVLLAFYNARKGRWVWTGVVGLLAALTRNLGVLLVIPLAYEYFAQLNFQWRKVTPHILWLGLIPLGIGIYMIYLKLTLGDYLAFVKAQRFWLRSFTWPWNSFLITIRNILKNHYFGRNLLDFSFSSLAFIFIVVSIQKKIRVSYLLFALIGFILPLWAASPRAGLFSMPRFIIVLFPMYMAMTDCFPDSDIQTGVLAVFSGFLAYLSIVFANAQWVA